MKVLGLVISFALLSALAVTAEVEVYTIQKGDTLEKIAEEKLEDSELWFLLAKYNNIPDPYLIQAGQEILIPSKAELVSYSKEKSLEARVAELERLLPELALEYLLEDNFEDDELAERPHGWLFPSGGRWGISYSGSRMLEQTDRGAPNSAALTGQRGWSSYIVQVELKIENSGDGGVFAYWNSHHENYRLRTSGKRTKLEIAKRVPTGPDRPDRYDTITLNRIPFSLEDRKWYVLKFEVTTHGSYTYLKGKVWRKGETEPGTWLLEASDHSSERYKSGLAGVWTIGVGESYRGTKFDNFVVFRRK